MIYKSHRATSSSYPSVLIQSWMEWIDDPVSIRMYPPCSRSCRMVKSRIPRMKRVVFWDAKLGRAKNWDERINITVCLSMSFTYFEWDLTVPIMALWMLSAVLGHHPGTSWELQSMASTGGGGNPSLRLSPKTQAIGFFLVPKSKSMEVAENKCWRWHGRGPVYLSSFHGVQWREVPPLMKSSQVGMSYHVIICFHGWHAPILLNEFILHMFELYTFLLGDLLV